jgi:FkbM family methyltransferase
MPRRLGEEFVTSTLTGSLYAHRTGDVLADKMQMCGHWDLRNLVLAAEFCAPGGRIIEIGANTGTETVGFAMIVGESGSVIAFEPEPQLLSILRRNVELNGFKNVSVVAAAVSDRNGLARFIPPDASGNSGLGHVTADGVGRGDVVDVPAITLDSLGSEYAAASFVTIDVEGHEIAVLRGAKRYLRQYRPMLVLEASSKHLKREGQSLDDVMAELSDLQYEAFEIRRLFGVRPVTLSACFDNYESNWLCTPKERRIDRARLLWLFIKNSLSPNICQVHPLHRSR